MLGNPPSQPPLRFNQLISLILIGILVLVGYWAGKRLLAMVTPVEVSPAYIERKLGAIVEGNQTTFRVWAPHAEQVSVIGSLGQPPVDPSGDQPSRFEYPLWPEGDGYWSAQIPDVGVGDHYKYQITNQETGKTVLRIDPYARQVTNSVGDAIVTDPEFDWGDSTQFQPSALNEMVIYEIHVGTFLDQPGGRPGTFDGVIEKLDYLQDLGVNTLKILPVMEFAGDYSWGYNPSHPFAVESAYGGPDAFKRMIKAAHEHGMAVILDVVYNHFGPSDLDLWQFDGWSPSPKTGGIYFYNSWRARTNWAHTRPNFGLAPVRQYIRDNVRMWLEEFKLDGLRIDSTVNMRTVDNGRGARLPDGISLMQEINDLSHVYDPPKVMIAEDHRDNPWITLDTDAGGLGFDSQWDPKFVHPIRDAVVDPRDRARNLDRVIWAISRRYSEDGFERVIYTESHDEVANGSARVPDEIWLYHPDSWPAKKRSTLGATIVFTSPGIPMMFQGQEFLEDRWFQDDDPLEWWRADRYAGIHDLYRDLVHLRRNTAGSTRGLTGQHLNVYHVNHHDKILAYHRWDHGGVGDDVIVIVNMTRKPVDGYEIGFPTAGTWQVRFNTDWSRYSSDFGDYPTQDVIASPGDQDGMPYHGSLNIGPWSAIILSQDA